MAKVKRIEIKTANDYNDVCNDLLTDWIEDFTERKGLTRPFTEENRYDFDCELGWMYTQKGMKLYESACSKLAKLGEKYFDENELDIKSSAVLFP